MGGGTTKWTVLHRMQAAIDGRLIMRRVSNAIASRLAMAEVLCSRASRMEGEGWLCLATSGVCLSCWLPTLVDDLDGETRSSDNGVCCR